MVVDLLVSMVGGAQTIITKTPCHTSVFSIVRPQKRTKSS